jgi:hypothetical protein
LALSLFGPGRRLIRSHTGEFPTTIVAPAQLPTEACARDHDPGDYGKSNHNDLEQ